MGHGTRHERIGLNWSSNAQAKALPAPKGGPEHSPAGKRLTAADEDFIRPVLIAELGCIALPRLKLDCDLLVVEQVCALEDDTKRALANLLANAIVHADDVGRRGAGRHGRRHSFRRQIRGGR